MPNHCKLELSGHLGRDPKLSDHKTKKGGKIVEFSVAFNTHKKGDPNNKTIWFDCVSFAATADHIISLGLTKGAGVYITSATPSLDVWTDKKTGEARSRMRWTVWEITDVDQRQGGEEQQQSDNSQPQQQQGFSDDDEIPF